MRRDEKKGVLALYRQCVAERYGFPYCDLLAKDPNKMFLKENFEPLELQYSMSDAGVHV